MSGDDCFDVGFVFGVSLRVGVSATVGVIDSFSAVDLVATDISADAVIARAAEHGIRPGLSVDRIVSITTEDEVISRTTIHAVVTFAAEDRVVACPGVERVVTESAVDGDALCYRRVDVEKIIARAADDVNPADRRESIRLCHRSQRHQEARLSGVGRDGENVVRI